MRLLAALLLLLVAAPTATADTGGLSYDCDVPGVGAASFGVVVREQLPVRAWPKVPTGRFLVSAEVSVPAEVADALRDAGTPSVRGHLELAIAFAGESAVVAGRIPETAVPEQGGFAFTTHAVFPRHVFPEALGPVTFSAGAITVAWSDPAFTCAPAAGQDTAMGTVQVDHLIDERPSRPVITTTSTGPGSIALEWSATSTLLPIRDYAVYVGHEQVATALTPRATITGLRPDTEYPLTVRSRDTIGQVSDASVPVFVRTGPDRLVYQVTGSSTLGPWQADLPLTGSATANFNGDALTADVFIEPATLRLWNGGLEADVAFGATALTGQVSAGTFTGRMTAPITAPVLRWFGTTHPTPDCRTESPVDVPLTGPLTGLSGVHAMPRFTGCGWLTDYLNTALAGSGNRVQLAFAGR